MTETERAALVDELTEAMGAGDSLQSEAQRVVYTYCATACLPVIDRLLAAADAPGLDELLVQLTDDMLPGRAVGIARDCGKWNVQQVYDGLDESWPTSIHGEGDSIDEALRNAVAQATATQEGTSNE